MERIKEFELLAMFPPYGSIRRELGEVQKHHAPGVSKRRARRKAARKSRKRNRAAEEVFITFDEAVDYKVDEGWKSQRRGSEWEDVCPDCDKS